METILLILILAISLICVFEYILIHRVENDTGDLWCEEFDSVRDAVKWLRRENDVSI